MDLSEWLRIEGTTPRERMRNGYKQLFVICLLGWAGARVVWELLSVLIGPPAAAVVIVVLGVLVGLDLRDRMIGPVGDDKTPAESANDDSNTEQTGNEEGSSGADGTVATAEPGESTEQTKSE